MCVFSVFETNILGPMPYGSNKRVTILKYQFLSKEFGEKTYSKGCRPSARARAASTYFHNFALFSSTSFFANYRATDEYFPLSFSTTEAKKRSFVFSTHEANKNLSSLSLSLSLSLSSSPSFRKYV